MVKELRILKKSRFNFLKVLVLVAAISLLSACSVLRYESDQNDSGTFNNLEETEDRTSEYDSSKEDVSVALERDKIISSYFMNLETLDFEKTKNELDRLIKKYKSFIENSNISFRGYEYSKNYRSGDFYIRVPKENVDKFKDEIKNSGNVIYESVNREDVTDFYRDSESRLKLVEAKEKRLLALLDKATKIEDIIAIESELTNTIYEKEQLEKSLKSVDEKIEYVTLNLNIQEVRNFSNTDRADSSLGLRIKNALKDSIFAFKLAIENFIIWMVFALPYILIILPILILLIVFIRRRKKR